MKNAANFKKLQRFFDHIIMYIGESADLWTYAVPIFQW